jgi:hypothetical protein
MAGASGWSDRGRGQWPVVAGGARQLATSDRWQCSRLSDAGGCETAMHHSPRLRGVDAVGSRARRMAGPVGHDLTRFERGPQQRPGADPGHLSSHLTVLTPSSAPECKAPCTVAANSTPQVISGGHDQILAAVGRAPDNRATSKCDAGEGGSPTPSPAPLNAP